MEQMPVAAKLIRPSFLERVGLSVEAFIIRKFYTLFSMERPIVLALNLKSWDFELLAPIVSG